jgi:NADH/NAD ratio-sensing transcriptional regulator Rex
MTLKNGKNYLVNSQRKGTFIGKLLRNDETWATLVIVGGMTKAMLDYNERGKGEEVTVRKSLCNFIEQPM